MQVNSINYNNPYNKKSLKRESKQKIAFGNKAVLSKADKFVLNLASCKPIQKLVDWSGKRTIKHLKNGKTRVMKNEDKLRQYLMVGYSLGLQTNYVANVLSNDRMPKKRKQTLAINNIISFFIPAIGAFTVDRAINDGVKKLQLYIVKTNKEVGKKLMPSSSAVKGVKAAASIIVFTTMYKWLSTVVATPIADKVTKFMDKKGWLSKEEVPHETTKSIKK